MGCHPIRPAPHPQKLKFLKNSLISPVAHLIDFCFYIPRNISINSSCRVSLEIYDDKDDRHAKFVKLKLRRSLAENIALYLNKKHSKKKSCQFVIQLSARGESPSMENFRNLNRFTAICHLLLLVFFLFL